MKKTFNVLIVGAGKIGALFDNSRDENILTHAHAFKTTPNFKLVGFVDKNKLAAQNATDCWGGIAFESIEAAFSCTSIDVATVAVPDEYHFTVLEQLSNYQLKLVFAEKPLTKKLLETQKIIDLYKQKKISLLVNYSRRFVPEFKMLKDQIKRGEFGEYISGSGYYGRGVLHNGSHLIDLLHFLLGEIKQQDAVSFYCDYYVDDPSVTAILFFENKKPFFLQAVNCRMYTIFEIDLLFSKSRIRITDSGFYIREYTSCESSLFKGYINLNEVSSKKTMLNKAMLFAAQNIHKHLTIGEQLQCSALDTFQAQKVANCLIGCINEKDSLVFSRSGWGKRNHSSC